MNENTEKKSKFPVKVKIIALILAILLLWEIVFPYSALMTYLKRAKKPSKEAEGWLVRAEGYLNAGDYENALSALETYATYETLSPKEFDALIQLKINLEKYDDALSSCNDAEKKGSIPEADIALYRAQIYYVKGDGQKAVEQAEKCRSLGGDRLKVGSLIALCREKDGDYAAALSSCLELIDGGLGDLTVFQQAAQDAYLLSDHETVLRIAQEALDKFGDSRDTLVFRKWLGLSYFETNDLANAETNLSAVIDGGESAPELYYLRGVCEMGSGRYEEAVADFTESLPSDELTDESLYNRGLCRIKLGDNEAAALDFQEVIDRDADEGVISAVCELLGVSPEKLR